MALINLADLDWRMNHVQQNVIKKIGVKRKNTNEYAITCWEHRSKCYGERSLECQGERDWWRMLRSARKVWKVHSYREKGVERVKEHGMYRFSCTLETVYFFTLFLWVVQKKKKWLLTSVRNWNDTLSWKEICYCASSSFLSKGNFFYKVGILFEKYRETRKVKFTWIFINI